MSVNLKTETIEGNEVQFSVSEDGEFFAASALFTQMVKGKDLADCRTKIRDKLRRLTAKLEIRAHLINLEADGSVAEGWGRRRGRGPNDQVRPIVITGIHARSGEILAKFSDAQAKPGEERASVSGHGYSTPTEITSSPRLTRVLTTDEIAQYQTLHRLVREAQDAFAAFVAPLLIENPKEFVGKAVEAKLEALSLAKGAEADDQDPRTTAPAKKARN